MTEESPLEAYEGALMRKAGETSIAWAGMLAKGRVLVDRVQNGDFTSAAEIMSVLCDTEYELTGDSAITSEFAEALGGYPGEPLDVDEPTRWLFGEEAVQERQREEQERPTTPGVAPVDSEPPPEPDPIPPRDLAACLQNLADAAKCFLESADPLPPDGDKYYLALNDAIEFARLYLLNIPIEDSRDFSERLRILTFLRHETMECAAYTSHPIYEVQRRHRIYGLDPAHSCDGVVWIHQEDCIEAAPEKAAELEEQYANSSMLCIDDDAEWQRVGYKDIWEFDQPFLTRQAAEVYIAHERHNLGEARIYVASGHRNSEWQFIRRYLAR